LTITDLGMVRSVTAQGEGWVIGFTPTYSGCPATEHLLGAIRDDDGAWLYPGAYRAPA
jgi:ring-1,2-phenylacetyl-CoA epoxidase subunit PaaD